METLKYIVKRILIAIFILFGVSIIIYALSRMMPVDYVDQQYDSAVNQGTMSQEDVDRIKEIYGLYMPEAFLDMTIDGNSVGDGKTFTKNAKKDTYERVTDGVVSLATWYSGSYDSGEYRLYLDTKKVEVKDENGVTVSTNELAPNGYRLVKVHARGWKSEGEADGENVDNVTITLDEELELLESGSYEIDGNKILLVSSEGIHLTVNADYREASFGDKAGAVLGGYFTWLGNLLQGDLGISFKFKKPVGTVIMENMGISFGIAFVATILQFLIAIPLGIKAATHQYGVIDYTVTVLTMIGISLPTFFLAAIMIRLFSLQLGWFPNQGLVSPNLAEGVSGFVVFGDMLWHLILPMFVLVILSIGSLMRYTRTNTLEVLNADYIRTARAKGLSEKSVIYKHAFRNTMIPLVTLMAGIIPSLFGGAMITEQVFSIPGIGNRALQALMAGDIPFIMGYNMFLAIMTVLGTLLSDLMYALVDPRVKIGK